MNERATFIVDIMLINDMQNRLGIGSARIKLVSCLIPFVEYKWNTHTLCQINHQSLFKMAKRNETMI